MKVKKKLKEDKNIQNQAKGKNVENNKRQYQDTRRTTTRTRTKKQQQANYSTRCASSFFFCLKSN